MKLYFQIIKLLCKKIILRKKNGIIIKEFAEKMGIVYIKLAQILATQNFGNLFTEADRKMLSDICDNCNPICYTEIESLLKQEYGEKIKDIFYRIDEIPIGSASVSQVHRAKLKTGEEVAIKIKRKDIASTMQRDIKNIRKLVHRFGRFIKFGNFTGGDRALDLYLGWIEQETNFIQEQKNIKTYQNFANSVNQKVEDTKLIKVPKLYEEYCTENIIVMEFISTPTINKIALTNANKNKITNALNSYIKLSFYAMFNGKEVTFHGDPHSGNICVDDEENICFLDMGLIFTLKEEDAKLCRQFFLTAYTGNYEKLYQMLVPYGKMKEEQKDEFKKDCQNFCIEIKKKEVTYYFMDMINICLKYEFVPPNFLFSMAKAFVCLNGINHFSNNECTAIDLLQEQTLEFLIKRSLNDCQNIFKDTMNIMPKFLINLVNKGFIKTLASLTTNTELKTEIKESLKNLEELRDLINLTWTEETMAQKQN